MLDSFKQFLIAKERILEKNLRRTIQELLRHRNLQTTMIYTRGATKNILGVRSPLDKI